MIISSGRDPGWRIPEMPILPEGTATARVDTVATRAASTNVALVPQQRPPHSIAPPLQTVGGQPSVGMVWHESLEDDPGHRWLRGVVAEVAAAV